MTQPSRSCESRFSAREWPWQCPGLLKPVRMDLFIHRVLMLNHDGVHIIRSWTLDFYCMISIWDSHTRALEIDLTRGLERGWRYRLPHVGSNSLNTRWLARPARVTHRLVHTAPSWDCNQWLVLSQNIKHSGFFADPLTLRRQTRDRRCVRKT